MPSSIGSFWPDHHRPHRLDDEEDRRADRDELDHVGDEAP
jgi:hypothetical protein